MQGAGNIQWLESPMHGVQSKSLLAYRRGSVVVVMNLSIEPQTYEVEGKLLVASSGVVDAHDGKKVIPARSCTWFLA